MSLIDLFRRKKTAQTFAPLPEDYPAELSGYDGTPEQYFSGIFRAAFPGFTVEENVSVKELFGESGESRGCQSISFLLRREEQAVLAVLLCPSGEPDTPAILNTMTLCQSRALPCHRYFTDWRNRSEFVVTRTREVLEAALAQASENKG